MRVFLTGGTGFIGRPLAGELRARGCEVVALVRRPDSPQTRALAELGARCVAGDIVDRESMREGMTGADLVVHNAAWYEIGVTAASASRMHEVNVRGTDHVLGLAAELRVPRVVYVSSLIAFGDTGPEVRDETFERRAPCVSIYERSKTEAHAVALQYQARGLPLLIVCPGNVIGPNDHSVWGYLARLYVNGLMAPIGFSGDAVFAHASVEDTAAGIALAAQEGRPGELYFLGGDLISTREAFALWETTPGGSSVRLWLPPAIARLFFAPAGPLLRWLGLPAFISGEMVRAGSTNFRFSNEKARRELGWSPRPANEVWLATLARERNLAALRAKRNLSSRLRPLDGGA